MSIRKLDRVFVERLRVKAIIGVYENERHAPQEVLISLWLYTDTRGAAKTDNLADCVDYDSLTKKVRSLVESANRHTIEALAGDIASLCLNQPGVRQVRVRVEKPDALPEAACVGVEIRRKK